MDKLKLLVFLTLLLCRFSLVAQQSSKIYGIIIKGGHVIDPKNNIDELMDVALLDGRIALIAKNINDDSLVNLKDIKTLKLRYNDNITNTGLSFIKGV